jgi:hypothetical protein
MSAKPTLLHDALFERYEYSIKRPEVRSAIPSGTVQVWLDETLPLLPDAQQHDQLLVLKVASRKCTVE